MRTEAEIRRLLTQVKVVNGDWKRQGVDIPVGPQREDSPASTLILNFWAPGIVKE